PPYNTGNDFVYEDDFAETRADYLARSGQKSQTGERLVANTESNGRFHSDWLSMMYPRLRLARNLLQDDGSIAVSISDHENAQLRKALDETFGASNFVAQLVVRTTGGRQDSRHFATAQEYVLVYARLIDKFQAGRLEKEATGFTRTDPSSGRSYKTQLLRKWGDNSLRSDRPNLYYAIQDPDGNDYFPMVDAKTEGCWRWSRERMTEAIASGLVEWSKASGGWVPYEKVFAPSDDEVLTRPFSTIIESTGSGAATIKRLLGSKVFSYPKSVELIRHLISMANVGPHETVLDFFAGSGTTAHAVMELNKADGGSRTFICIQVAEAVEPQSEAARAGFKSIAAIGRERIRRAGAEIRADAGLLDKTLDTGFRSLRVDTTNMAHVLRTPDETDQQQLTGLEDSVKADRTDEDLLFQVMVEWGLDLSEPIAVEKVGSLRVLSVADGALIACFADEVTEAVVKEIANRRPLRAVFLDAGFASDAARINAEQIFREVSPETEVRAI
ncbi:MAG TPA: site-specific DNA-methyltransferase, partial [Bacillota bacterium]|nr:site-specific DNA-methyltransferase [Bacillota bacterium]